MRSEKWEGRGRKIRQVTIARILWTTPEFWRYQSDCRASNCVLNKRDYHVHDAYAHGAGQLRCWTHLFEAIYNFTNSEIDAAVKVAADSI